MHRERQGGTWDCVVVGAGPAGLNAALVLGRARRRVLVLDGARPRNAATHQMHGVLGHDGLDPADLRARGREELARYGVEVVTAEVDDAGLADAAVRLHSARGSDVTRTVLLATGMLDELPDVPGFAAVWGTSAHTCPYCDGFEHRDERLAVLAAGARGGAPRRRAAPVVGRRRPAQQRPARPRRRSSSRGCRRSRIPIVEARGRRAGERRERPPPRAFAWIRGRRSTATRCSSTPAGNCAAASPAALGCELRDDGSIVVDAGQATTVDRVYAAGNCADPRALVPAAAGSGATAAVAINARLSFEDADHAVAEAIG